MTHVLLFLTLLAGCAAQTCTDYGVREDGARLEPLISVSALTEREIFAMCGPGQVGCVKHDVDGYRAYWRSGDKCAKYHEMCHLEHGLYHTIDYHRAVIAGVGRPTCPRER